MWFLAVTIILANQYLALDQVCTASELAKMQSTMYFCILFRIRTYKLNLSALDIFDTSKNLFTYIFSQVILFMYSYSHETEIFFDKHLFIYIFTQESDAFASLNNHLFILCIMIESVKEKCNRCSFAQLGITQRSVYPKTSARLDLSRTSEENSPIHIQSLRKKAIPANFSQGGDCVVVGTNVRLFRPFGHTVPSSGGVDT
jgi:hypothetical protein